jgi:2-keto-4-pentenoate hydratase
MDSEAIRRAALTIRSCWENRRRLTALPEDCRPKRLRDGYEIQRELETLQGAAIGWKIAATSEAGQQHIGVDAPLATAVQALRPWRWRKAARGASAYARGRGRVRL